jgi:hypothetical protein
VTEVAAEPAEHHGRLFIRREAVTMALYVSITLLAALTVTEDGGTDHLPVLQVVWGTTIGLALAHWCAFSVASHLVGSSTNWRRLDSELLAELAGAGAIAGVATLTVIVFPTDLEWAAARFSVAACVGIVAYAEIRTLGGTRSRAIKVALVALVLAESVATVKRLLGH